MREVRTAQSKPVVVAVDGSAESEHALLWAVHQASRAGQPLRIVTCYQHFYATGEAPGVSWGHFESTKRTAQALAQDVIERVMGSAEVEHVLSLGPVDSVLIDHSRDAAMVVIGTRSSFGIRGKIRSSTTDRVTGKAACPVISIPLDAPVLEGVGR